VKNSRSASGIQLDGGRLCQLSVAKGYPAEENQQSALFPGFAGNQIFGQDIGGCLQQPFALVDRGSARVAQNAG